MSMIEQLREKANKLPLLPGVYIMRDARGEVIYVGKAKALKNRVSSYFRGEHLPKVAAMVNKVADFEVIIASSEFEALVLENSLIKRHQPHYNILLRDDKTYPFIRLDTKSEYPTFSIVGRTSDDGARYFGPYGGRNVSKEIIGTICRTLKLPTCTRKLPRDIGRDRPCLELHMGSCAGYCRPGMSAEEYRASISQAEMILSGKVDELVEELTGQMLRASDELRYEQAALLRDRIKAVSALRNKQRVIATAFADTDAVGFCRGAKSCFTVLHYTDGALAGKDFELMDEPLEDDAEAVSGLVRQYYSARGTWPGTILLPCEPDDMAGLEQFISEAAGKRVRIECPKRGDKVKLTQSAQLNAREECTRATTAAQRRFKTLEWLRDAMRLEKIPERIEAFDVSNTGSSGIVAAMTVFVNGRPLKRDYRKFRIKDADGQDDYGSMCQVVQRRFKRLLDGDKGFADKPDLLLIDGGQVHAQKAEDALAELEIYDVPVFGMVKDDRHRTRALAVPGGGEIGLSGNPAAFALIGNIQEETHRCAIEYHRSLRDGGCGSQLDSVPGVGEKRRNALLREFKTLKAVREADIDELRKVVPANTARAVYDYFHPAEEQK